MASKNKTTKPKKPVPQWVQKIVPLSDLKPYEKNPRIHSPEAFERLKKKISRFGYHGRVIATPDLRVIGGHLRLKALAELGIDPVAVLIAPRRLTDDEYRELLITDNLQDGEWDLGALQAAFSFDELAEWNMPQEILDRFSLDLDGDADAEAEADEATPEPPVAPVSAPGDVWLLGAHRVMCGDSSSIDAITALMAGERADLLLTDPPYGIKRDKGFHGAGGFGGKGKKIPRRSYSDDWDSERPDAASFALMQSLADTQIIWGGNFFADILPVGNHWLVWDKLNTMPTFGDCELAWTNVKRNSVKKVTIQYNGLIGREKERFHPTQKPVALGEWCIENYGEDANKILDLFLGSGSTLIACEKMGRACYGMEMSPAYCDVIVKRWQAFTGLKATHAESGKEFDSYGNQKTSKRSGKKA